MTARWRHSPILPTAGPARTLRSLVCGVAVVPLLALAGCGSMGDGMTTAFADPGKYQLYECKQLETERKALAARLVDLQGLMTKAETGVGGAVVSELAYRNEYIAVRGQAQFAEQAWDQNKCVAGAPAAGPAAPVPPVIAPAPEAKGGRGARR